MPVLSETLMRARLMMAMFEISLKQF